MHSLNYYLAFARVVCNDQNANRTGFLVTAFSTYRQFSIQIRILNSINKECTYKCLLIATGYVKNKRV